MNKGKFQLHFREIKTDYGPACEITVLITYQKRHSLNIREKLPSGAIRLISGQSLCLLPYFMCAVSEGSDETVHMHSFV